MNVSALRNGSHQPTIMHPACSRFGQEVDHVTDDPLHHDAATSDTATAGDQPERQPANEPARVAKILDEVNLVINRGRQHGTVNGQRFVIFTPGEEVHDPETGQSLGTLELVKGHARVIHVQEKLAILRLERSGEGRTKTLSEIMATLSGRDETKLPEVAIGDCARPVDEETGADGGEKVPL